MGLAATKLHPPEPPQRLVQRSRLADALDAAVERNVRLILLSAPAGSGKTTLLASWLASRPGAVGWLQVEERDSDPARFWSYLARAIGTAHPRGEAELSPVVIGSNGDDLVVVSALVNLLVEVAAPLVVVINDYHLIESPSLHQGVERLIELCPHHVTIVISTRIDPPFRLGRLRVRDHVAEVRAADLRFSCDEAPLLLGAKGRQLRPELVDQLCERTEGWAAALVLAGLSLQRTSDVDAFVTAFRGDDQLVVDYLRDELLTAVGEEQRRRLLETSVLDRLTGGLVDAVTGSSDGAGWLRDTAGRNQLLTALDRTDTWFRYHHLFRDLLRADAEEVLGERIPELHARAAGWFETQGDDGQAVVHCLAAGDLDGAARLLRVHGTRLLRDGQIDTLRGFLDQLGELARTRTWCALLYAWCEYMDGHYALADTWLDVLRNIAPDDFDHTVATSLHINISLARGDVATALASARDVDTTGQLPSHSCDLSTATGQAYVWAGDAGAARRVLHSAARRAVAESFPTSHVRALVYLAIVEFDQGTTAAAYSAACAAIDVAQSYGLGVYHGVGTAYAIRARTSDDPATAHADAVHAVTLARRASTELALGHVLTVCADTLLDLGDAAGQSLLAEARAIIARCPDPGVVARHLARTESRHHMSEPADGRSDGLVEQLTERELAVLRYLPSAMSQRDIATELYVSLNTVKTHCRGIYRKLQARDRKEAVQAARDLHLL